MTTAITQNTLASAARTTSGVVDLGASPAEYTEAVIYIDTTAAAGTTPSLTVMYQSSPDGITFYDHTAGVALTAAGRQAIRVTNAIGRFGRISYAITGTAPSFTFSVICEFKRA